MVNANNLVFHTVAEGFENRNRLELSSAMGGDVVQCCFMSRPVDEDECRKLPAYENGQDMLGLRQAPTPPGGKPETKKRTAR